ncbi:FAD-dependent thymidylate synthase [Psychrobacillus sp. OK032]|uniref:FAD-dependent thymidylate synthase n=1 Tax=Psychrobacillus sp. OK032 TaxID=1884358 RepID=UPI0008BD1AED|nr:FAD-dependent thymidylate synthase [Psychrobacillus sp. OK032]SER87799.1 thymidylate synthase (FAD) [Psychrobacillus sp. OK032]
MTQIQRKVTLISHTQLAEDFRETIEGIIDSHTHEEPTITDGQALALTAIRTCYSPGKPSEIVANEGKRYFKTKASDGKGGTDADRLIRMIVSSGHTSTLEHLSYNFAVEGISRALLAQITRHRVGWSFSIQSQRYVRFGSGDKSGGFDYVVPDSVKKSSADAFIKEDVYGEVVESRSSVDDYFADCMRQIQEMYDNLRSYGIPAEDARAVLPQATSCNGVISANLRAILDFYGKRKAGNGAQAEIAGLSEDIRKAVVAVEPWTDSLFDKE